MAIWEQLNNISFQLKFNQKKKIKIFLIQFNLINSILLYFNLIE